MCIIAQLHYGKSIGVKGDQMDFIFFVNNGKNYSKSIFQNISFHNELSIGNPMSEDGSEVESIIIEEVKLLGNILLSEMC